MLLLAHLATSGGALTRVLSWWPVVWVGQHSYEIYLWHFPLIVLLKDTIPRLELSVVVVVTSLVAAWASHRFVSEPLNARYKARLSTV